MRLAKIPGHCHEPASTFGSLQAVKIKDTVSQICCGCAQGCAAQGECTTPQEEKMFIVRGGWDGSTAPQEDNCSTSATAWKRKLSRSLGCKILFQSFTGSNICVAVGNLCLACPFFCSTLLCFVCFSVHLSAWERQELGQVHVVI